jgi:hypothetical protein
MKNYILALAIAALASVALAATASADVPRYQSQTATFTMTQPADAYNQWANVWKHDFKVEVNSCDGTFSGTGFQSGHDSNGTFTGTWTITGRFLAGNKVSFTATRFDGLVLSLDNAPMGNDVPTIATLSVVTPQPIEEKVSAPVFTTTSSYKNHGQYVSSQGGGADAAHSCIGMPINSSK